MLTHFLTLANPAGTGAIAGETKKIIEIILGPRRMGGTGNFLAYPNEGATGAVFVTAYRAEPIIIANGTQRLQYSLDVANDDWDLYCFGYWVRV